MKHRIHIKMKQFFQSVADNLAAAVLTLLVVLLFVLFPLSFSRFNTVQTMREQYNLMDTYFMISNHLGQKKPYRPTSSEIVIVDIKEVYDRDSLADLLKTIVSAGPKAVGLDVFFSEKRSEKADSIITEVALLPNVVSPVMLAKEVMGSGRTFSMVQTPFYMDGLWLNAGFVNLATAGASGTCRVFAKHLPCAGGEVDNFDMALLRVISEQDYTAALERDSAEEYINYSLSSYSVFSAASVPYNKDMLKGKIVLVGDRDDSADKHVTAVDSRLPGVDIHAMTLATMLDGRYINVMSEFGAWLLAFFAIFFFLPLIRLAKKNEWTSVFCPVFQTILIILAIFLCYVIFVSFGYYIRVVYALLGIGFIELGYNLYIKLKDLCVRLFSR